MHVAGDPPVLGVAQRLSLGGRAPPTSLAFDAGACVWSVAGAVQEIETGDAVVTEEVRPRPDCGVTYWAFASLTSDPCMVCGGSVTWLCGTRAASTHEHTVQGRSTRLVSRRDPYFGVRVPVQRRQGREELASQIGA